MQQHTASPLEKAERRDQFRVLKRSLAMSAHHAVERFRMRGHQEVTACAARATHFVFVVNIEQIHARIFHFRA